MPDVAIIRHAATGDADIALYLLRNAKSTSTTLSTLRALRGGRLVLIAAPSAALIVVPRMLANDCEVVCQFMYERTAPRQLAALTAVGLLYLRKMS